MTAGCLFELRKKSILQSGTTNVECIAMHLVGSRRRTTVRSLVSPAIRGRRCTNLLDESSVRQDSCVRWAYQTGKVTSGITREFKRRFDTLHIIHSKPMDQSNNFKTFYCICDYIFSMVF